VAKVQSFRWRIPGKESHPERSEEDIPAVFSLPRPGGSGIGLANTFRFVQLHNGQIEFESEVGRGTTFRVELPLAHSVDIVPERFAISARPFAEDKKINAQPVIPNARALLALLVSGISLLCIGVWRKESPGRRRPSASHIGHKQQLKLHLLRPPAPDTTAMPPVAVQTPAPRHSSFVLPAPPPMIAPATKPAPNHKSQHPEPVAIVCRRRTTLVRLLHRFRRSSRRPTSKLPPARQTAEDIEAREGKS